MLCVDQVCAPGTTNGRPTAFHAHFSCLGLRDKWLVFQFVVYAAYIVCGGEGSDAAFLRSPQHLPPWRLNGHGMKRSLTALGCPVGGAAGSGVNASPNFIHPSTQNAKRARQSALQQLTFDGTPAAVRARRDKDVCLFGLGVKPSFTQDSLAASHSTQGTPALAHASNVKLEWPSTAQRALERLAVETPSLPSICAEVGGRNSRHHDGCRLR
jgi:hypothetical protein